MTAFSLYTAFPRGYCAGVHRAVDMLMQVISTYPDEQIYVNHEIIHNSFVIKMFERKGVIFESDLTKIPDGSLLVISAHGSGPSYFAALRSKSMRWVDATCPLVEKVHREARDFIAKGYHILYIGKRGHQEAIGVIDEGEKYFTLIEKEEDLEKIEAFSPPEKGEGEGVLSQKSEQTPLSLPGSGEGSHGKGFALLTQTTLSVDDTTLLIEKIQEKFPDIILPKASDICYATTNRQKAVKVLAEKCDLIFVVGSKSSSNSNKLRHVAESLGTRSYLIDDASEIDPVWLEGAQNIGITAGASGPEELVVGVVKHLESLGGAFREELRVVEEKMEFPYVLKILS